LLLSVRRFDRSLQNYSKKAFLFLFVDLGLWASAVTADVRNCILLSRSRVHRLYTASHHMLLLRTHTVLGLEVDTPVDTFDKALHKA